MTTYDVVLRAINPDNPVFEMTIRIKAESQAEAQRIVMSRYQGYRINHTLRKDD